MGGNVESKLISYGTSLSYAYLPLVVLKVNTPLAFIFGFKCYSSQTGTVEGHIIFHLRTSRLAEFTLQNRGDVYEFSRNSSQGGETESVMNV